ncbi:M48 family metalloprotease [Aestuariibacter halophilus]|uniref:Putative beta-barrel assembly-enhancing protease n=1 Tax=Fluctibacter halophilus TaxID=226011 RepID=A0ABS8G559_9ALTE|nr:M48 family metalloprotease [Aestuariibacter halophilus]MCC2615573.1 M48 family metalloprotease [Aestuariibacter halophilus]
MFCAGSSAQVLNLSQGTDKNALPEIGVVASDAISIDKELQIGDVLMRQLRGQAPMLHDPLLQEYVQDLGNRLVVQADNVKFPFEFFVINNSEINAFAFFGGHIGVHTGLIVQAENESEVASVLAHEVSHVTQRHLARSIQAQQKASPLAMASMFGGLLLALANPEAGIAAMQASSAASRQASINYTRSNEQEADRVGMQILAQAGFDPNASASFFQTLAAKYRNRSKPPAFLLTHPLPESRISDVRSRAQQYRVNYVAPNLSFHLAKARIVARYYHSARHNISLFTEQLEKTRGLFQQAARYGLVLSYLRDEQLEAAQQHLDILLKQDRENLFYLDTATDIALAKETPQVAISLLREQEQRTPRNPVVALNLANALMEDKQTAAAIDVLRDFLLVQPEHYLAQQLLADAYRADGRLLEMHQSKAEIYAALAAYDRAIDELHSAYNYASERQLEKQRIRARIDQFREAQQRLKTLR